MSPEPGSSLYIFEGGCYSCSDEEQHWGKSALKFELCPITNKKKFEDCDLNRLCDMPSFKNYPDAIPTPDGKKIPVFSTQIIVSPEIQNLFHLYDPLTDSWQQLPALCFPYNPKLQWMLFIDAYSFINDRLFFIQLCSGMFALDLESPEKGWDFLGDPSHDDPCVPWDGGYFPTINNKFGFLDGMIFDVIDVGLSREERKSGQLSSFPSTDIKPCYPETILSSVTLVHHDIHDDGVVHWCALKSKYILFPKDTRCHSRVLIDVRVTDLANLNTSITTSLKLLIDHGSSLTYFMFVPTI